MSIADETRLVGSIKVDCFDSAVKHHYRGNVVLPFFIVARLFRIIIHRRIFSFPARIVPSRLRTMKKMQRL